jgi:hypothetical protein
MYVVITEDSNALCHTLITTLEMNNVDYIEINKAEIPRRLLIKIQITTPFILRLEKYDYLGQILPLFRRS